jgi:hypothetical protein
VAYKVAFVMDELAWRDPPRVARRMQILKEAIRRMQMDHRLNDPLRPFSCRIFYEHEPPSHKFTFDMDGFGWGDLRRAGRRMQILLDALTKIHLDHLRHYPKTPSLYDSGVVYEREPPGREDWQDILTTLRRRGGDCEDLATWRAAELMMRGVPARAFGHPRPMMIPRACGEGEVACEGKSDVGTLWHILVRWPNGKIEDPSKKLGMQGAA